jgi:phosphoribosyl-ATP pyrophosphohydrolase/phosphoribosyl-AMP cyclohydrolase
MNNINIISQIDWQKCNGLIPAIIQNHQTLEVIMLGFMNEEALTQTIKTNKVTFYSRTKQRLWQKGEESGNTLDLIETHLDCDKDTLLITATPNGPTCHLGTQNCFKDGPRNFLIELETLINSRIKDQTPNSYIASLHTKGVEKVAQKVGEEAVEAVIASLGTQNEDFKNETADLIFHLLILLATKHTTLQDITTVLQQRNTKVK